MKRYERFLIELRAKQRAERNRELENRLTVSRTTEDMMAVLCGLQGLNIHERQEVQKKEIVLS